MPTTSRTPASSLTLWEMTSLVGEIGYLVAIPAVLLGMGGAWLDKEWGTKPWLTIAGLALAITLSVFMLIRTVRRVLPL